MTDWCYQMFVSIVCWPRVREKEKEKVTRPKKSPEGGGHFSTLFILSLEKGGLRFILRSKLQVEWRSLEVWCRWRLTAKGREKTFWSSTVGLKLSASPRVGVAWHREGAGTLPVRVIGLHSI